MGHLAVKQRKSNDSEVLSIKSNDESTGNDESEAQRSPRIIQYERQSAF